MILQSKPSATAILIVVLSCLLKPCSQQVQPIQSFMNFLNEGVNQLESEPPDQPNLLKSYDFIVVGAGTAGCVIANRLTEIADWKVLLIEAGQNENFVMDIPLLANYLQFTSANWKYKTKPSNKYCAGFENKQCNWPRGKVVGGSSVLNYMIYTRGAKQDYDNWEALGNEGWSYKNVLEYFKKIETFNIPSFDNEYHGHNGYLSIEHSPWRSTKSKAWVKGAQELGFKYGDHNGKNPAGVSFLQLSMRNGTRHSASRAYLHPINKRNNLHLAKGSMVTKLLFDESKTKVIGVEMERRNIKYKILAEKEVIVSGGAINSPQLLMLSGIGPKKHLESLKIPVIKDLKVGYNLMDHIAAGGLQFVVGKVKDASVNTEYIMSHLELVFQWMKTHKGPLSLAGGCEALVFLELEDRLNSTGWPDMELLFITGGLNSDPTLPRNFGFDDQIFSDTFGPLGKNNSFMVFPMLMRPKSRGRVLLQSKNPYVHPSLIPNYFEYTEDLKKIVEGMKLAIEIARQPAMKKIGTKLYDVPIEECLSYGTFGSDAYFRCHAQMFTFTIYHQSGTCKMGPKTDQTAVVDPRLRVHGVQNLRVIDASIMPEVSSSHTNAPVYMIAEKGADMIKQDWGVLQ